MANRIHRCSSCQLWSVSGGIRICLQNYSSTSGSGVMRVWSFADFQGSGWKPGCFFPCPSNIVTALANGAIGGSSWKLVSVLPCPSNVVTALANGAIGGQTASFRGSPTSQAYLPGATCGGSWQVGLLAGRPGSRQVAEAVSGVRPACKTSNIDISAPRHARAILTADLDTWQGRLQNFKKVYKLPLWQVIYST
jgi:hypothetical protein